MSYLLQLFLGYHQHMLILMMIYTHVDTASTTNIVSTSSIWHISRHKEHLRSDLSRRCIVMCLAETGANLDPAEFEALIQLTIHCASVDPKPNEGICVNVFSSYSDVPTLWQWNACYFGCQNSGILYAPTSPASLVERCFLSNFDMIYNILTTSTPTSTGS
jgi:hypothetical protein